MNNEITTNLVNSFEERYIKATALLEESKSVTFTTMESMADLGECIEALKEAKGSKYFEYIQSLDLELREHIFKLATSCHNTRKRGRQQDPNQLTLAFGVDKQHEERLFERKTRPKSAKWLRYIKQTQVSLQKDIAERPIDEWDQDDIKNGLLHLRPVIQIWNQLKEKEEKK